MVYLSRKPVCIDSKVVDRIDRGSEAVFRCAYNHHVSFSPFFNENLPRIEARVQQVEKFLENFGSFKSGVRVVVLKDKPNYFVIQDRVIFIGEPMLEARGHIEKALLKIWYRDQSQNLFAYENLFEEVYTDFVLYLIKTNLKIEDPFKGVQTKLAGSRWPQVLKSMQAYCQSPWKKSEHYQFCSELKDQDTLTRDEVIELSLRPLLVSSWIEAYKNLNFRDQYTFVRNIKDLVANDHNPDLPLVRTGGLLPQSNPLAEASEAVKNVSYFLTTSQLMQNSEAHRVFVSLVANNLHRFGFNDSFGGAYFDVLYITDSKMDPNSEQFKQFITVAKQNPRTKIAIKDKNNLWMLPSVYPIRWKSLENLRADRTVYSKCGNYDFNLIWPFINVTDKLMILNVCEDKKINLAGYIKEGPEGFGSQNKGVSFIQFHIPSLLMRKDQLSHVDNIYDLVTRRELDNPVFQSLGWQEIKYSEKADAYRPKAFVDGIEWFKVQ
jgi:hypothetical protein